MLFVSDSSSSLQGIKFFKKCWGTRELCSENDAAVRPVSQAVPKRLSRKKLRMHETICSKASLAKISCSSLSGLPILEVHGVRLPTYGGHAGTKIAEALRNA